MTSDPSQANADLSRPTPVCAGRLSVSSTPGARYREDLKSWAITANGGSIAFDLQLDAPRNLGLVLTLCSGIVDGQYTDCPVTLRVNGTPLLEGFDPHNVNWYPKEVAVPASILRKGGNSIVLSLSGSARTVVFVRGLRTAAPRIRKSAASLTSAEQRAYVDAVNALNSAGRYGPQVAIHADMSHRMHGSMGPVGAARFLPWHRAYLITTEDLLRSVSPGLTIPYWDWTTQREIPSWLVDARPSVAVPAPVGSTVNVTRSPGAPSLLPNASDVDGIVDNTSGSFTDFEGKLESVHNDVHVWVGGTMARVPTAPADPIFWMHHAQIDRLWARWQARNPGKNPPLTGNDAILDPWTTTEPETRLATGMGYLYQ